MFPLGRVTDIFHLPWELGLLGMVCMGCHAGLIWDKESGCLLWDGYGEEETQMPCSASSILKCPLEKDRMRTVILSVTSKGITVTRSQFKLHINSVKCKIRVLKL